MKIWKILPLLLVLVLIFCGCADKNKDGDGDGTTTPQAETAKVDLSGYKIVYPLKADATVTAAARTLSTEIKNATGTELKWESDWLADDKITTYESPDAEILIGSTNRKESVEMQDDFSHVLRYTIKQVGNKVLICGGSDEATVRGVEVFLEMIKTSGKLEIEANCLIDGDYLADTYPAGTALYSVIHEYKIIFAGDNGENEYTMGTRLSEGLSRYTEGKLSAYRDKTTAETSKEILIGNTTRQASKDVDTSDIGYYDYKLLVRGEKIILKAGSDVSMRWAVDALVEKLVDKSLALNADSTFLYDFDLQSSFDFDSFTPSWLSTTNDAYWDNVNASEDSSGKFNPPSWMKNTDGSNFLEKAYALAGPTNGTSRITTQVHRGDVVHYSEGSLESIASCIWAGIDVIEMDIHVTKDGVAILHHDDNLKRMTNVDKFLGKTIDGVTYPGTYDIYDWTYEQICALNLREGLGNGTKVTTYKIPTLYEALKLCSGRIFVQIDDKDSSNYSRNKPESIENTGGYYELAAATGSKACFLTQFDGGRGGSESKDASILSEFDKWVSKDPTDTKFSEFVETIRGWVVGNTTYNFRGEAYWPNAAETSWGSSASLTENPTKWTELTNKGRYHIWSENPVAIATYIAEKYHATNPPAAS